MNEFAPPFVGLCVSLGLAFVAVAVSVKLKARTITTLAAAFGAALAWPVLIVGVPLIMLLSFLVELWSRWAWERSDLEQAAAFVKRHRPAIKEALSIRLKLNEHLSTRNALEQLEQLELGRRATKP